MQDCKSPACEHLEVVCFAISEVNNKQPDERRAIGKIIKDRQPCEAERDLHSKG